MSKGFIFLYKHIRETAPLSERILRKERLLREKNFSVRSLHPYNNLRGWRHYNFDDPDTNPAKKY